ncbi:11396_t:CDS:2, partial [Ambispora leptoticha]
MELMNRIHEKKLTRVRLCGTPEFDSTLGSFDLFNSSESSSDSLQFFNGESLETEVNISVKPTEESEVQRSVLSQSSDSSESKDLGFGM